MTPVLDTGALIALERRDRRMIALMEAVIVHQLVAFVPAGVVAQAWRGAAAQQPVARLLRAKALRIDELNEARAYAVGLKLADTGSSDVVDAHVALLAGQVGGRVFTSDPDDIRRLDPRLPIEAV